MPDALEGAASFTSPDFASGYWQVKVSDKDIEKHAVVLTDGLYEL